MTQTPNKLAALAREQNADLCAVYPVGFYH